MAAFLGYQCEFLDPVSDDLYCKKCTLVSRKLSISTCCGESFCQSCIADTQKEGKPCPECGEKDYNIVGQVKSQKRISCLQVYCSVKERGCGWSGTLEQLDTHLDPDQDNCQYVDTKCPLNCHMTIPKSKVEQHVAQHCAKRPYVCQHCNFKATYEEVVDKHLPECKYVPLQCPNLCGVTFERDFMEDHMKMCHLEEVGCEFSGVGCEDRFIQEDQEEHTRQNSQKHLTLTASLAVDTKEQLQQKLLDQDIKHKEEEEKLKQKIEELNTVQQQKLDVHKQLLEQQFNSKLQMLEQMLKEVADKSVQNEGKLSMIPSMILNRRFEIKNFSREIAKHSDWKSPAMYTHVYGYKFCIGVEAHGSGSVGYGKSIWVDLWSMPGEYDDQLKWPANAKFTVELIDQNGPMNVRHSKTLNWKKTTRKYNLVSTIHPSFLERFIPTSFIKNDTLYFDVSEVELL